MGHGTMNGEPLEVICEEPFSQDWFDRWQEWFEKKAGPEKAEVITKLFEFARVGHDRQWDAHREAKAELKEMLKSISKQIKLGRKSPLTADGHAAGEGSE